MKTLSEGIEFLDGSCTSGKQTDVYTCILEDSLRVIFSTQELSPDGQMSVGCKSLIDGTKRTLLTVSLFIERRLTFPQFHH